MVASEITDRTRIDFLARKASIPYKDRKGKWIDFDFNSKKGIRNAIDAAIRAERKAKSGGGR